MASELKRYATLEDVQKDHRTGYALKHRPTGLLDDYEYYTWHYSKPVVSSLLDSMRAIRDERVIPIGETDLWREERKRIKVIRLERKLNLSTGSGDHPIRSGSSA